jgi:hypothetical protein
MHIQHSWGRDFSSLLYQNVFLAYYPPYSSIYNPLETDPDAFINSYNEGCENLFTCGNITKIGFPFWGENRPKECR